LEFYFVPWILNKGILIYPGIFTNASPAVIIGEDPGKYYI